MTAKVIQGSFLGGQPTLPPSSQAKTVVGPPTRAFSGRPPGLPMPSFAARPGAVQRHGGGAFAVEAGALGLLSGGGRPLPDAVRGRMEAALGADFSAVRVHVGPQAERIGAIAFTVGSDIYFAPGRFQPETRDGQQLLGHELAHVVQQRAGRVRNPLGSRLAVVQDHALEAEADRLGQHAAHRLAAQAKMPSRTAERTTAVPAAPVGACLGRSSRSMPDPNPSMIQRTIWRFDQGKWVEAELGTKGAWRPGPAISRQGQYFNDVSGKTGRSIDEVRAGLADLLLSTGSLGELRREFAWPDDVWKGLKQSAKRKVGVAGGHINVGKVTLLQGYSPSFKHDDVEETLLQNTWNNFLKPFMEANGQLPYIRRQRWFTQSTAKVVVDINFYYNRLPNEAFRFHKDTGGDNLFVNLVFNNKDNILATEWIEDFSPDASAKKNALRLNMPDDQRQQLRRTRAAFHQQRNPYILAGQGGVRGGVVGRAAYVSWVDELIWHSTPAPLSRTGYYKAILTPDNYWKYKPYAVEAMRVLYHNGKQIEAFKMFCLSKGVFNLAQVTTGLCDAYMKTVGNDTNWRKSHMAQIDALASLNLNDLRPILQGRGPQMESGVDLDADPLALTDTMNNTMKDTGIRPQVRRRNSFAIPDFSISNEKRSFIRTWVRVHRRDVRSAAEEYEEIRRDPDRYFDALDLAR